MHMVDCIVFVALAEERDSFFEVFHENSQLRPLTGLIARFFNYIAPGEKTALGVVIDLPRQGDVTAAMITERALSQITAKTAVSIGISGALTEDVHVGDIVVPTNVWEYSYRSKALEREDILSDEFDILFAGQEYPTSESVRSTLKEIVNFQSELIADLGETSNQNFVHELGTEKVNALKKSGILGDALQVHVGGTIVAGPVLGASNKFKDLLLHKNRLLLALDMESSGVASAVLSRADPPELIVIRGISDNADHRKKALEKTTRGLARHISLLSSARLLQTLLAKTEVRENDRRSVGQHKSGEIQPGSESNPPKLRNDKFLTRFLRHGFVGF